MEQFANVDGLVVGQQKEWAEIFTGAKSIRDVILFPLLREAPED